MRRFHIMTIIALLALAMAFGFGAKAASVTNIEFWGGWTGPDGDVMRSMVDRFNAEHPDIHVTLTTVQWTPLYSKFMTAVRAGNAPDLMATHVQELPYLARLGLLEPVDGYVAKAGLSAGQFIARAWEGTFVDGKQYGLPLDMHMHGLYYNVTMFEHAGITHPPTTGSELVRDAIALTVDVNGKHPNQNGFDIKHVKQWGLGLNTNHHAFYIWFALMKQQGVGFLDKAGTGVAIEEQKGINAWKALEDLVYRYHVTPQGELNATQDFLTGQVAMVVDGTWQLPAMERQKGLKWGVAPFPRFFGTSATWGSGHVLILPKGRSADSSKAAMELALWIIDHSDEWAQSGNIPVKLEVLNSARFKNLPGRAAFVTMLPYTVFLPSVPNVLQAYSATAPGPIILASQAAMLRNESPKTIIRDFTERMDVAMKGR